MTKEDKPDDTAVMAHMNFRMFKADALEVKLLALRDDITIQAFLNRAVTEYCAKRGVTLSGKDPRVPFIKPK